MFEFIPLLSHLDGGWMMGIIICWFLLSNLDGCCSWVMEIGFDFGSFFSHKVGWWGNPLVAFLVYLQHLDNSRMMGRFNCLCLISFLHSHILTVVGWWELLFVGFFSHILMVVVVGWWRYFIVFGSFFSHKAGWMMR